MNVIMGMPVARPVVELAVDSLPILGVRSEIDGIGNELGLRCK